MSSTMLTLSLSLCLFVTMIAARSQDPYTIRLVGLTTSQVIEARGYVAKNYYLQVEPGYKLNLIRIYNPAIKNSRGKRGVVVFLHGISSESTIYLVNSLGATPRDYSKKDPRTMSTSQLKLMLSSDPSATSLPFMLSNFNYDVWMVNRRSAPTSLNASGLPEMLTEQKAGGLLLNAIETPLIPFVSLVNGALSKAFGNLIEPATNTIVAAFREAFLALREPDLTSPTNNAGYWRFSMDNQAKYDVPKIVNFVLSKTKVKTLAIVGHSLGAAIIPMAMTLNKELNNKISAAILFAPAVGGGNAQTPFLFELALNNEPFVQAYSGPLLPTSLSVQIQLLAAFACQFDFIQASICNSIIDLIIGNGTDQLIFDPGNFQYLPDLVGSRELLQLSQAFPLKGMHFYNYSTSEENLAAYGQPIAPPYNFSRVTNRRIAIFQGDADGLVIPADVENFIKNQLQVPVDYHFISLPGSPFNHLGAQLFKRNLDLVNIPCLKIIANSGGSS